MSSFQQKNFGRNRIVFDRTGRNRLLANLLKSLSNKNSTFTSNCKAMTDEQRFKQFISTVQNSKMICLLQASDGLFAMLEDENGKTFLPIWSDEKAALENAVDLWAGYTLAAMSLAEMINWCDELQSDEIQLGIEAQTDGKILPLAPEVFKNIFVRA